MQTTDLIKNCLALLHDVLSQLRGQQSINKTPLIGIRQLTTFVCLLASDHQLLVHELTEVEVCHSIGQIVDISESSLGDLEGVDVTRVTCCRAKVHSSSRLVHLLVSLVLILHALRCHFEQRVEERLLVLL